MPKIQSHKCEFSQIFLNFKKFSGFQKVLYLVYQKIRLHITKSRSDCHFVIPIYLVEVVVLDFFISLMKNAANQLISDQN